LAFGRWEVSNFRATSARCHRRMVSGVDDGGDFVSGPFGPSLGADVGQDDALVIGETGAGRGNWPREDAVLATRYSIFELQFVVDSSRTQPAVVPGHQPPSQKAGSICLG